MELKTNHEEQKQNPVSVLQGDGLCISRIMGRKSSLGQSSRIFYRAAEGVPFKWEMQPGTPINQQEEDEIPPLSPSPLMQSMGLPLPNLDHDHESKEYALKTSKIWKMVKKRITSDIVKKVETLGRRSKRQVSSMFGDSSFSSNSSSSSSSSSQNNRVVYTSMIDGPFCCSPCDVPAILDEGNTRIYYCSHHRKAFAVEDQDGSFLSRILPRVSTTDQFSGPLPTQISPAGVPFRWEMQPGTPKNPPENELIPPPSPPPAMQNISTPPPRLHGGGEKASWKRAWFWIRGNNKKKETEKLQHNLSLRNNEKMEVYSSSDESGSVSSMAPFSNRRRDFCWSRRKDILILARRKFKSFTS